MKDRILALVISIVLTASIFGLPAQTVTSLYQFSSLSGNNGNQPFYVHLIQATDGAFYGTTEFGGSNSVGSVFKITSAGSLTVLYQFNGSPANDGEFPEAGVVQGADGNFYGTTYEGGSNSYGTVFKITPAGALTNLHIFQGTAAGEGIWPFSPLVQGTDGLFYGTTSAGGTRGAGTVFKIDSLGNLTTIYSFTNGFDGSTPYAGLFQGSDGLLYGTTHNGGSNSVGTAFKINSAGSLTVLHQFGVTSTDGQYPIGGLIQGYTGDYYGTTFNGGTNGNGMIFRMTSTGLLTNLYSFGAFAYDGLNPRCGLVQGSDSYLYGTTYLGGTNGNAGTLFKIGPAGGLIYLHDFDAVAGDGVEPCAAPVEGYDGNYYGTTYAGGSNSVGVIYKFAYSVPTNPNQSNITDSGNPNSTNNVVISINSVAGEGYQLQFTDILPATVWSNIPGAMVTNAIGGPLFITNPINTNVPTRFFRFQIMP